MSDVWPDVFWDPPAIREARRVAQKPRSGEEIWAWLVLRRISIYVSALLARISFITPNRITAVSIIIPVILGLLLGAGYAISPWIISLVFNLSYLLDCVDGEVARLTGRCSIIGVWLDKLLHLGLLILWLGVCLHVLWSVLGPSSYPVVLVALVNGLFGFWVTVGSEMLLPEGMRLPSVALRKSSTTLDFAVFLFSSHQGFYLMYPILAELPFAGDKVIVTWVFIHLLTEAGKNLWRIKTMHAHLRLATRGIDHNSTTSW